MSRARASAIAACAIVAWACSPPGDEDAFTETQDAGDRSDAGRDSNGGSDGEEPGDDGRNGGADAGDTNPTRTDGLARAYATGLNFSTEALAPDPRGGYVLVGHGDIDPAMAFDANIFAIRISASATIAWARSFDDSTADEAYAVAATDDGVAIAGATGRDNPRPWVLKTDRRGDLVWERRFEIDDSKAYAIASLDDGYVVAGYGGTERSAGFIIRLTDEGDVVWRRNLGDETDNFRINAVCVTSDGGFMVVGEHIFTTAQSGVWLNRLDSEGRVEWQGTVLAVDSGTSSARAVGVAQTRDDGFLVTAYGDFDDSLATTQNDVWIIKTDPDGEIEWQNTYGDSMFGETAAAAALDADGHLHIAGRTLSALMYLEINPAGSLVTQRTFGVPGGAWGRSVGLIDGRAVLLGEATLTISRRDAWVLNLDADGAIRFRGGSGGLVDTLALPATPVSRDLTLEPTDSSTVGIDFLPPQGTAISPDVSVPTISVSTQSR